MRIRRLQLVFPLLLMVGCASNSVMKRPFMFNEAKLPGDFPSPGAVGEIIIKEYPAYRLARIHREEGGNVDNANGMFRPLFRHIKRNDISMTAPVEMSYVEPDQGDEGALSMAFLYREASWGAVGPDADDQRVVVEDVPAMDVVSIGVRGGYTNRNFKEAFGKLKEWIRLREGQIRVAGPPRYLAYNSPFILGFLKYGEVQLPIEFVRSAREADVQ